MDHWSVDPSDASNWYPNKWTSAIQQIEPLSNWLEQPFTKAACSFDYLIIGFGVRLWQFSGGIFLSVLNFSNWSKQEKNGKQMIQVIQVIVRILLLPWIQWTMIQVIERYKSNVFF